MGSLGIRRAKIDPKRRLFTIKKSGGFSFPATAFWLSPAHAICGGARYCIPMGYTAVLKQQAGGANASLNLVSMSGIVPRVSCYKTL